MRPNGTNPGNPPAPVHAWSRVTSMGRWLARRRSPAAGRPRLSVVMPVYNAEMTLAECLTRLCNSSFGDFEIVLVDDGSTDQTRAIAANFPVRVVPTAGRGGPGPGRDPGGRGGRRGPPLLHRLRRDGTPGHGLAHRHGLRMPGPRGRDRRAGRRHAPSRPREPVQEPL